MVSRILLHEIRAYVCNPEHAWLNPAPELTVRTIIVGGQSIGGRDRVPVGLVGVGIPGACPEPRVP